MGKRQVKLRSYSPPERRYTGEWEDHNSGARVRLKNGESISVTTHIHGEPGVYYLHCPALGFLSPSLPLSKDLDEAKKLALGHCKCRLNEWIFAINDVNGG